MKKILVIGACGQIGSELVMALRERFGGENVVATGRKTKPGKELLESGPFESVDCTRIESVEGVVKKHDVGTIHHLPALLSAVAEADPQLAWKVNVDGLCNVLEVARESGSPVFVPSSIGVFGPGTPQDNTPQDTVMRPTTIYGVTKVAGELLCDYYYSKYGVDVRGVRYPGLISYVTPPGGGTTDYAVDIYYEAIKNRKYKCFLNKDTCLPMMYMPDALRVAVDLMEADPAALKHRNAFNVTAMSFTPEEMAAEIKKHIPEFVMEYDLDPVRQGIADSWPNSIDDSVAREEWGWKPEYDLASMTTDMLEKLSAKFQDCPLKEAGTCH